MAQAALLHGQDAVSPGAKESEGGEAMETEIRPRMTLLSVAFCRYTM